MTPDLDIWQSIAARNNCLFLGYQEDMHGRKFPAFKESQTGGFFMLHEGETVGDAVARVRGKFKEVNNAQV